MTIHSSADIFSLAQVEELLGAVPTIEELTGTIAPPELVPFDEPPPHAVIDEEFVPEPTAEDVAACRSHIDLLKALDIPEDVEILDAVEEPADPTNALDLGGVTQRQVNSIRSMATRLPTRIYKPSTPEEGEEPLSNPALVGAYPVTLPIEVAMAESSVVELAKAYRLQTHELQALIETPRFSDEVARWRGRLKEEGMSFRLKAAMMSEKFLETVWHIVQDDNAPANVRADLIKWTADVAGNGPKKQGIGDSGPRFALQINLSGRQPQTITVEGS